MDYVRRRIPMFLDSQRGGAVCGMGNAAGGTLIRKAWVTVNEVF